MLENAVHVGDVWTRQCEGLGSRPSSPNKQLWSLNRAPQSPCDYYSSLKLTLRILWATYLTGLLWRVKWDHRIKVRCKVLYLFLELAEIQHWLTSQHWGSCLNTVTYDFYLKDLGDPLNCSLLCLNEPAYGPSLQLMRHWYKSGITTLNHYKFLFSSWLRIHQHVGSENSIVTMWTGLLQTIAYSYWVSRKLHTLIRGRFQH